MRQAIDAEAEHEEADDDAPPAVDRLDPVGAVPGVAPSGRGMMAPRHSGQSPQPRPEPVLRTMTPMTIIA